MPAASRGLSLFLFSLATSLCACGGGGSAEDARCRSLCEPVGMTPASGYGSYCDGQSVTACKSSCGVRISGAASLCATCLLEKASFGRESAGVDATCDGTTCTETNSASGQKCTYPADDEAQHLACQKKLYPLTAESCGAPTFRPVSECATLCSGGK